MKEPLQGMRGEFCILAYYPQSAITINRIERKRRLFMRVWSKGLGNMTLNIDFNTSDINWEDDTVIITGWIRDPVVWNYKITFEERDFTGFLKIGVNRPVFRFGLRSVLRKLFPLIRRRPKKTASLSG
jgi:hypothetical protein